jgi:hypothetical protein
LELVLFFDQPTPAEVDTVKSGRAVFGLYDRAGLVVLCYRFVDAKGGVPWSDAPYADHLVPERDRVLPPDPGKLSSESRAILHVVLVNATGGQIRAMRAVSLSPELTRGLFSAIGHQAAGAWDARRYDSQLKALYFEFPTADRLAGACSIRCEGGA